MKNQFSQIRLQTAPSWLVILLCVNGIQSPTASEFEAAGTLTYAGSSPNGRVSAYADLAFKVFYRNGNWLMQTFPAVGGRIGGNVERHEMGMVNNEIYFVSKFRTNRVRRLMRFQEGEGLVDVDLQQEGTDIRNIKPKNEAVGAIYGFNIPRPGSHFMHPLWIAFISGEVIQQEKRDSLPRFWISLVRSATFTPITDWRILPTTPALAEYIRAFNAGSVPIYLDGKVKIHNYKAPFDRGFMESEYIMLNKTNLNGLTLPLEFELRRYVPLASATHTNDLWLASSIKGIVNEVLSSCSLREFKPKLTSSTLIGDYQVPRIDPDKRDPLQYLLHPGDWRTMEEVQASDEFKYKAMRKDTKPIQTEFFLRAVLILGVISVIVFYLFLWRRSYKDL